MNMSLNDKFHSVDIKKDNNNLKLVHELCAMTGCDQEEALHQLNSCDFDFESAANRILESCSTNIQVDSEWQLINRQKKSKKKQEKIDIEPSGDGFKKSESNRHTEYKIQNQNQNQNQKVDHFKNEDKLNNNRAQRNRKNRFTARKPKETIEVQNLNNTNIAAESFHISDSENELRWDNVADIDGAFKESGNNSQGDGFYSEDDFGPSLDDHSYHGISTQLVSDIHHKYKAKINPPNNVTSREQSCSSQPESQIINEYLSNQLPIFGNFSKTQPPPSTSIILDQPVSFFRDIKPTNVATRKHYNFGINVKEELTVNHLSDPKCRNTNDETVKMPNTSEQAKTFLNKNANVQRNDSIGYQPFNPPAMTNEDVSGIMNTIIHQKRIVAMMLGNHQAQNYYEFPKPINMISMPNSNYMEQMYAMNMNANTLLPCMENSMPIQSQDGFISQSTFLTSNTMSVPFHANRK